MRRTPFANLTCIFPKGNIPTIMQAIFDGPVSTYQCEQAQVICLFGCQAGHPIDDLLGTGEGMFHSSAQAKDLPHAIPVACKKIVEFG